MSLSGKVAVITGASMGIGEAIARVFVSQGASAVLSSRELQRVEAARARIGTPERTLALPCDVRSRPQIERLARDAMARFGRIDIWVNNAGHGLADSVADMDMSQCRAMFDTNLFGAIDGMQVAAEIMRRQGSGTIVNISSVAGHLPIPFGAAYCATKFALNAIGKAANLELRGAGVNVITVCPGYIRTNFQTNVVRGKMASGRRQSPERGATAEQVARAVLRAYLRRRREVIVPGYYTAFIRLYQLAPGLVEWGMARFMKPDAAESGASPQA